MELISATLYKLSRCPTFVILPSETGSAAKIGAVKCAYRSEATAPGQRGISRNDTLPGDGRVSPSGIWLGALLRGFAIFFGRIETG